MDMSTGHLVVLLILVGFPSKALGNVPAFSKCDFEDPSICNFVQDTKDDFNWTRTSGSTPSSDTGPSVDHTYGTSQGHYMYIEATSQNTNDIARLWTPPYSATSGLCIEWFYHMHGDTVNTLNVYVVDSTGTVGAPVWTKTNKQGQMWILGKVSVPVFGIYQIMFEGIRGSSYTSDIALDDVKISYRTCSKQDTQCDFEDPSICNFVQDTKDDFNWTRTSGSTPSSNTGPSVDHTHGTSQGHYMYIEATNQKTNDTARLWTPPYPATDALCIEWFYHMHGDTVNTLNVYVVDSTGTVGAPVWTKTNKQGQMWILGKVSVAVFGIYQIMFEGIRGSSYKSDIAIDDVKISNRACWKQDTSQCGFEDPSICNFVQDTMDDFHWTRRSASTPSKSTGPSFDHTYGSSQGYYMYIEATGQNTNDTARLWTPSYPATNGLCIEWFYHMYGETVNTLNVYVVDSTGTVGTPVWTKTNHQGDFWILGQVSVAAFGIYQIMFEGIRGSDYTSDIGLDDVTITNGACLTQAFTQCDFEDPNICDFVQDTMDDFDWTRKSASTPSSNTGPSFDHTYRTAQGFYMYIEATGQRSNNIARLWTPSYPATNGLCIEWFYHMYGETVNTLNVYVVDSTGNVGTPVWTKTNNQGNIWILGKVSVTVFGIYQIMFEGIRGSDYTGDISLDDVKINSGACLTQGEQVVESTTLVATTQQSTTDESTTVISTTHQSTRVESTTLLESTPIQSSDVLKSEVVESTTLVATTQQSTTDESTTVISTTHQSTRVESTTLVESTPIQSSDVLKSEGSYNGLLVGIFTGIAIGIVFTLCVCIIIWKMRNSTSKATRGIENEDNAGVRYFRTGNISLYDAY